MKHDDFIFTTTHSLQGYDINEYIGVDTAEVIMGTGKITDLMSSIADSFGVRAKHMESNLDRAMTEAFELLRKKAEKRGAGANAAIGITLDFVAFENDKMGLLVTATIVVLEKKDSLSLKNPASPASEVSDEGALMDVTTDGAEQLADTSDGEPEVKDQGPSNPHNTETTVSSISKEKAVSVDSGNNPAFLGSALLLKRDRD